MRHRSSTPTTSLSAAEELARCQRRLANQLEQAKHWRERAISAEQALGLYGPKETSPVRRYSASYCDEATDSGHSSSNGLGAS